MTANGLLIVERLRITSPLLIEPNSPLPKPSIFPNLVTTMALTDNTHEFKPAVTNDAVNMGQVHSNHELAMAFHKEVYQGPSLSASIKSAVTEQGQGVKEGLHNQEAAVLGNKIKSHDEFAEQRKADEAKATPDHKGMEANRRNEEAAVALFAKPIEAPDAYAKAEANTFKHVDNPHQPEVAPQHHQKAA